MTHTTGRTRATPGMPFSELIAWNEQMAARHDIEDYYARSSWIIRWIELRRVSAITHLLDVHDSHSVLEVGCGAGHLLERICHGQLLGVDLSRRMLERARQRLGAKVMLAGADAHALPFLDNSFDRIVCSEVLEHVWDPASALVELARVARSDARIVISLPHEHVINGLKELMNAAMLTRLILGEYHSSRRMDEEWHLHSFNLKQIREIVPSTLRVVKVEYIPSPLLPVRFVLLLQPVAEPRPGMHSLYSNAGHARSKNGKIRSETPVVPARLTE